MQQFDKHPGKAKVGRKEYRLTNASTNIHVRRDRPFDSMLNPGDDLDMKVLYRDLPLYTAHSCPRCKAMNEGDPENEVKWYAAFLTKAIAAG